MRFRTLLFSIVLMLFLLGYPSSYCFGASSKRPKFSEIVLYKQIPEWLTENEIIYVKKKEINRHHYGFLANIANMGTVPYKKEFGIYIFDLKEKQERVIKDISEIYYDRKGMVTKCIPESLGLIQGVGGLSVRKKDKAIAFTIHLFNGESNIYMMDCKGGKLKKIAKGFGPKWSPDGNMILYKSYESSLDVKNLSNKKNLSGSNMQHDSTCSLWIMYPGKNTREKVVEDNRISSFIWHPDGKHVIYYNDTDKQKYIVSLSGQRKDLYDLFPGDFSPDGSLMLARNSLYEVDTGREIENVNWPNEMSHWVRWSPQGGRILGVGKGAIAVINKNGENFQILRRDVVSYRNSDR